jgi:HemY protein
MSRLVLFLVGVAVVALGLSWLADRPGALVIDWQDYRIETTVFRAVVILSFLLALAVVLWSAMRQLWLAPASVGQFFNRRRQQRGLDAISGGMIAIGAGDRTLAMRFAQAARKSLPNEPMTHMLRAQTAQLAGDRATSRRIFEAMLASPDTEQLGLRGLFLEAEREHEIEAAMQFAERALRLNPKLAWAADALFDLQCKRGEFAGAIDTLTTARKHGHVDKAAADRRRAVLLTAQAQAKEEMEADKALALAGEAHSLAPDLVPAAVIAGRLLASRGQTARAAKIIESAWKRSPHPELATVYAYVRPGDSPRDRLDRVRRLAQMTPNSIEAPIALAETAIASRDFVEARRALEPLLHERLTQRVCKLMAHIESSEGGDKGRVREWLARAVNAPRDPAWTADGYTSDRWLPVSPVTGALDVFKWRVPVDELDKPDSAIMNERMEALVALGIAADRAIAPSTSTVVATPASSPATRPDATSPADAYDEPRTIEAEPVTTARPVPRPSSPARPVVVDVAGAHEESAASQRPAQVNGHVGDGLEAIDPVSRPEPATASGSVRMARIKSG